jgi:DNA-binding GntR family transcriptional regulator
LRSLRRQNLREDSLRELRGAILTGELEPGSIHSATSLAESLGVSPTPVREAMLELSRQGLVEPLPNQGFRIIAASEEDLDEIQQLRLMLEIPALALVAERASREDLMALRPLNEAVEEAARAQSLQDFLDADRTFHLSLLALAGNDRLVRIVGELRDQARVVGLGSPTAADLLEGSAAEHAQILDALLGGKVAEAQQQMVEHLHFTRGIWAGQSQQAEHPETIVGS